MDHSMASAGNPRSTGLKPRMDGTDRPSRPVTSKDGSVEKTVISSLNICPQEYDAACIEWRGGSGGCAHFATFWTTTDVLDVF